MEQNNLRPLLEEIQWGKDVRHNNLTPELEASYGRSFPADGIVAHLSQGFDYFLEPLKEKIPKCWHIFHSHSREAYIIESLYKIESKFEPGKLSVIIPAPCGYASLRVYQGTLTSPFDSERRKLDFSRRTQQLPRFFRGLVEDIEAIGINNASPYHMVPDIGALLGIAYGNSVVNTFISSARKRQLTKQLGDLSEMCIIGRRVVNDSAGEEVDGWYLFFNNDKTGDGETVWVALDPKFKDVRKLVQIEEAYDLMLEHYLLGKPGEFDFRPFTEAIA